MTDRSADSDSRGLLVRVLAFLRCGSCRFAAIYFIPFYVALVHSGLGDWRWILFGATFWLLFTLGTEFVNRLSDQEEDRINRPERTEFCTTVGFEQLKVVSVVLWTTVIVVDILWLAADPNPVLGLLLFLGAFSALSYSYGLRLKRNRYLSSVVLTFPFFGTFLTGWSVSVPAMGVKDSLYQLAVGSMPFLFVVVLFMGAFAGIKDITDVAGDERVGYRSLWISVIRRDARSVIRVLIVFPYAAIVVLVLSGLLTARFLWLLTLLPASSLVAYWASRAKTTRESQAAREIYYQFWYFYVSAALLLFEPRTETLWVLLGAGAYWIVATQYLHWSGGVTRGTLKLLLAMVRDRQ